MTHLLSRADFPAVGDNRFFLVTHNPKSVAKPVKVELREAIVSGKLLPSMSRLLAADSTVADRDSIIETAAKIEARVGRIDDVVGVY